MCGQKAICSVYNHISMCDCPPGYTGNAYIACAKIERPVIVHDEDHCTPSPCGQNSHCSNVNNQAICSCLPGYYGTPPACRRECAINSDCANTKACVNERCIDPCPGSCSPFAAECRVINHKAVCSCLPHYTGDAYVRCTPITIEIPEEPKVSDVCFPSPCGANARCRSENGNAICECIRDYHGNAYEGCRPECTGNSDCPMSKACIHNKCQDPCIGICGVEAVCTVSNHIPICSCPVGTTGDAFRQCVIYVIEKRPDEQIDPCYPSPCSVNTVCRNQANTAVCECISGYFGDPNGAGCHPECVISSDCPRTKSCVNNKCVDPCPDVCGYGATCRTVNHSPICSCPDRTYGDPFVECRPQVRDEPTNPCVPNPCNVNGYCRVVNGAAVCTYPECITNDDCSTDRSCFNQKCSDPCLNACGVNAICHAINHQPVCSCPPRYVGSPYVQCVLPREPPTQLKPECESDSECPNDKACINEKCQNPCAQGRICGENAVCHVQAHRPLCVCHEGYTGNAQIACYEIGCRADNDCPTTHACVNRNCVEVCDQIQCGRNAICRSDYSHHARCYCLDGYRGNPLVSCERPECTTNNDCPFHLACLNERCQDPCNCAKGAQCRVDNHVATCKCLPGYVGDAYTRCTLVEVQHTPQCTVDADCPSKLACFSNVCKNPCTETRPCGPHAVCSVVDSLPLRTMVCTCEPGFVGNADHGCNPEPLKDAGCVSNDDCGPSENCQNRICENPCKNGNPCDKSAECLVENHRAVCTCPPGFTGDPFVSCFQDRVEPRPKCTTDSDCPSSKACINQACRDPCIERNPCSQNAECRTIQHHPTCHCPTGWAGDPQRQCYKPECKINSDCPYDKACYNEKCFNPCTYGGTQCGRGAECLAQNHQANCICPAGTQGNPLISCVRGICQYNEDCLDDEACDRLNRVCRKVCDIDSCTENARCEGRNHQPVCTCLPGLLGNPYVQCSRKPDTPQCTTDSNCPPSFTCVNQRCENPCARSDVCDTQQTCTVLDTSPIRSVMCRCPPDTVTDARGHCKPINYDAIGCRSDDECSDPDKCINGACVIACSVDRCGINAQCESKLHRGLCSCPPGYTGNPHIECSPIPKQPNVITPADCYTDDDCPFDRTCRNERCVNPCYPSPCGRGAFCFAENHQPICKCPSGFTGSPLIACIPSPELTVGCKSNSGCTLSESCVNELCTSPCNCGVDAECHVQNHHPICVCKPGYSGNPQFGCFKLECQSNDDCSNDKTCYNNECINPCVLGDPCAVNAECFGLNHQTACRCLSGYKGSPFERCERIECSSDFECPGDRACLNHHCVNPCEQDSPCAPNAICFVRNHAATCKCPEDMPNGNPLSYCERIQLDVGPECKYDDDCPSKLACIREKCVEPCKELTPCAPSARCSVLDSSPVRTMVCECPELFVPDENGECRRIIIQTPPGCKQDSDCPTDESCINRQCRSPCDCGPHATCLVKDHRATCSCLPGYEGNPNIMCRTVGCRSNSECDSGRACINGNCVNPCVIDNPCGLNAECYVTGNRAECRCFSGYRGNPFEVCRVIGCRSNSDCPSDKACENAVCVNPCVYDHACAPHAECSPQNHMPVCKCQEGFTGNPYVDCRREPQVECTVDGDCSSRLACINHECVNPCTTLEPCVQPSKCEVVPSLPVRTMICICPEGYVSSGNGTCKPLEAIVRVGGCVSDSECPSDKACINDICRDPCACAPNAICRVKDHKPICSCEQGYDGQPEIQCTHIGCRSDDECSTTHSCINRQCVPVCAADGSTCGERAECYGINHNAVCECRPGFTGNPKIGCNVIGCTSDSECPTDKACINTKCESPCEQVQICERNEICRAYNHKPQCSCPPGTISEADGSCRAYEPLCRDDSECPSQHACINSQCINPCNVTQPCGVNAECKILDTTPIRTLVCVCVEGYQGNAAVQCDRIAVCRVDKGFVPDINGNCVCPPGSGVNIYGDCVPCRVEDGYKVDETGRCVCALERGFIIDERGRCVCPTDHGYKITPLGECVLIPRTPGCVSDDECADFEHCNIEQRICTDVCADRPTKCGFNAFCNGTNHQAICQCITDYEGNAEIQCYKINRTRDEKFPVEMNVNCLADGVKTDIHLSEQGFNGVIYVKGYSKDEECRRVINVPNDAAPRPYETFKVHFGSCGLIHVNGVASFVLVIQKHPKLVTYKAQAYHVRCVYQTGEQNVTLGFNVQMLTTAGTIANTGPPPICLMRIVTQNGQEINSAEIGDNLMLQVDVQPQTIYGGFARSCIAKTMEDNIENEYVVTDENGCATDPSIFGEWEYSEETNSLLASFNAFKFPSSNNIRFQCNIRVCFGRCQPVNCRGANAFGKRRRRREINDSNSSISVSLPKELDGMDGTLREEITISSNAILTFEKRDERFSSDGSEIHPAAQRVEDICVSMIGLIIALVITALLALVAVAVAVSCWLMAYRRRPKATGPLPHPPEFPNPLFTNPDAVSEPTPDYLS